MKLNLLIAAIAAALATQSITRIPTCPQPQRTYVRIVENSPGPDYIVPANRTLIVTGLGSSAFGPSTTLSVAAPATPALFEQVAQVADAIQPLPEMAFPAGSLVALNGDPNATLTGYLIQ